MRRILGVFKTAEALQKNNVAFSIAMNAQKSTDDTRSMSCTLREYVGIGSAFDYDPVT